MDRIAISGIGIVRPGAFGREAVIATLPVVGKAEGTGRVPDFPLEEHLQSARAFRRVAGATKFGLAAMSLAVVDAGFSAGTFGGDRVGVIVGITHGAVPYSIEFHRTLMLEGPLAASPLHFSESVPNAPAGNAAIAFQVRGPVHTLIGEEPVGTQAIELAAGLLQSGLVERCLVAGTEEWSAVVTHAYAQIDRAARRSQDPDSATPLSEGAAALVLESERAAGGRDAAPRAVISGWSLGRCRTDQVEGSVVDLVREAFRPTGYHVAQADHVVLPLGRLRRAAQKGCAAARGESAASPVWVDLAPLTGNPAGAANLLQVATSAALISAGKVGWPGLVLSTGITGTLAAVVLSRGDGGRP